MIIVLAGFYTYLMVQSLEELPIADIPQVAEEKVYMAKYEPVIVSMSGMIEDIWNAVMLQLKFAQE